MAWGPSRIEQIPDIKRIIVAPAVTGGPQTAAKHHPPRTLLNNACCPWPVAGCLR